MRRFVPNYLCGPPLVVFKPGVEEQESRRVKRTRRSCRLTLDKTQSHHPPLISSLLSGSNRAVLGITRKKTARLRHPSPGCISTIGSLLISKTIHIEIKIVQSQLRFDPSRESEWPDA